jgi:hypothetical protein
MITQIKLISHILNKNIYYYMTRLRYELVLFFKIHYHLTYFICLRSLRLEFNTFIYSKILSNNNNNLLYFKAVSFYLIMQKVQM